MSFNKRCFIAVILSTILAAPIFLCNLNNPAGLFWDENYHIPSAQRYLSGVFFMEPHPPLGKLLIAAGEYILNENEDDSSVAGVEKASSMPDGFSFRSYRLFPAIAGWLAVPLLTWGLALATSSAATGFFLSTFYIFENGIVLHSRGAMLDSFTWLFASMILALWFQRKVKICRISDTVAAITFGLGVATKLNFIFLAPLLIRRGIRTPLMLLLSAFIFLIVMAVHMQIGKKVIESLPDSGWYETSSSYRDLISSNSGFSVSKLLATTNEWFAFSMRYQNGVPKLNYCKEEENGSYPILWPLGARAINYKWESKGDIYRILYLQVNPFIYGLTLLGLLIAISWNVSSLTGYRTETNKQFHSYSIPILISYFLYMFACIFAGRVFYLYHYFIPFLLSLFCLALIASEIFKNEKVRNLLLSFAFLGAGVVFYLYSPFTYYKAISEPTIKSLSFLNLWNLHAPHSPSIDPIARPNKGDKHKKRVDPSWSLAIGDLKANYIEQEWGTPAQNLTDEGKPIVVNGKTFASGLGVHAKSRVQFDLSGKYSTFEVAVGVPDAHKAEKTSVKFKIICDGETRWQSSVLKGSSEVSKISINVRDVEVLSLIVDAGGDGNDSDHAVWIEPFLR